MSASRTTSFPAREISRSRSEGTVIDLDDGNPSTNCELPDDKENKLDSLIDWSEVFKQHVHTVSKTNPFWNELSASNPFVYDVAQLSSSDKINKHISILKEDPYLFSRDSSNRDSFASSGDELDIDHLLREASARKSGRSKSVSHLLDIVDAKRFEPDNTASPDQILASDMEWLQNDRAAYKMAWLSHRQLARSCLNLDVMSHSPGWAQTQATDNHVVCKLNHEGGSVQLPNSDITVHIPKGHVSLGEFQEVGLRAILNPPQSLNHDLSSTVSPLIELTLNNLNTKEAILLEMKIAAEVKKDPFSQIMTEIICFYSLSKEGPFEKLRNSYIYKDTIQVKLTDLSHVMYTVVAVQTNPIQSLVTSVWEYIHRTLSIGIYGPKHIHPSFTAVFTVFSHNYIPEKLTVCDIKKGAKSMPPVVFQLWGKHTFSLDKPQDLSVSLISCDPDFEVKVEDQRKEIKEGQLKAVLSTVSEKVYNWKALADVLGYSHMSLDDLSEVPTDKESERVGYVVKKLKEDCHANRPRRQFLYELIVALLKLDCQGLVARITQDTVLLTSAVKLGKCWRELAERSARLTKQQIEAYEVPHRGRSGEVALEMMWKPAYDFLYTWGAHYGDSYRDMLQDLQLSLDKMKNPLTKQWRELTGALILVNCMEILRANAFPRMEEE
ncbi:metastasis-associated in colon cancer protein 1 isoform X5 [Emydura macquarii macquarii]|uniref:metastasis-associated in colon cancer protein 1 isoform X5 n=1 Tax=Emydura macquarii macquarii TaxID=1129001 RepID=UPI00352BAA24